MKSSRSGPIKSSRAALSWLIALSVAAPALAQAPGSASPDLVKLQLKIDLLGLAKTTSKQIEKAVPAIPQDEVILLNGQPPCLRLLFDGEKLADGDDNNYGRKHLLVFPFAALAKQNTIERQQAFNEQIASLNKMILHKNTVGVQQIPIFPQSDAAEVFHNQERFLHFKDGAGISFIASYGNGDPPLNKKSQFYCFQGLTADKHYYVSFFWPLTVKTIAADQKISDSVQFLKKLPRDQFSPSLDKLDRVIQSLELK